MTRTSVKQHVRNYVVKIVSSNQNYLNNKFFKAQCESATKEDWVSSVKKLMCDINLDLTFEDIIITKVHISENL